MNYHTHTYHTNLKKITVLYQEQKIWNSLPTNIKDLLGLYSFKKTSYDGISTQLVSATQMHYIAVS
jgi:hypothetical protein